MKKAPEAFRTISEVSDILDTPAHVLRFWESKFYQIRPVKRAGGRRYYRPDDLALLAGIRLLLQDQGMTIRGVQKILQEQGVRHVSSLAAELAADVDDGLDEVAGSGEAPDTGQADAQGDPGEAGVDHATPSSRAGSAPPPLRVVPARPPAPLPLPLSGGDGAQPAPQAAEPIRQPAPPAMPAPEEGAASGETDAPATPADAPPPSPPPPALDPPAGKPRGAAGIPAPDLSDLALNIAADTGTERPARRLRALPRHALEAHHDQIVLLARRIDALLDRMSDASGVGRW